MRDFTKWDDTPVSLPHFARSFVRAYKIAMTPPFGPVAISLDAGLQQEPMRNHGGARPSIPRYVPTAPPQGDSGAVKEAARLLANAQNPVIVADRAARTPAGVKLLVELAETLQARVVDQGGKDDFPRTHYLSAPPSAVGTADGIIGLELSDFWGHGERLDRQRRARRRPHVLPHQRRRQAHQHQRRRSQTPRRTTRTSSASR